MGASLTLCTMDGFYLKVSFLFYFFSPHKTYCIFVSLYCDIQKNNAYLSCNTQKEIF